ncbi:methylcobalamin:coenzyme M methyltransferase [Oxobacter pfennigii]|uniref:Methylcobalamin:coenzyme M methyltransferase n=1 Tax=Oxobacter pfennigii TaxID=36849 RepID=A0A0N8NSS1_9CLOT|nr:uroporphyrinogen decarboxylase family protein [Oxobacter pfennigii]KPU42816.1 methylcobalamin:coenzyme M methyltransferase [Oxobacter pfennigii]
MTIPKFDEKELKTVGEMPSLIVGGPSTPLYDFPVSRKEAYIATLKRKPVWLITNVETRTITPTCNPDNVARAFAFEDTRQPVEEGGGKDMFGIEWVYVPVAGGSMVKPGAPLLSDANEWEEKLVWPDIDSWDWEKSAKNVNLSSEVFNVPSILNGWFERLISFMDFDKAVVALIDDDQKDAVKALFDKLSDLYIKIIDKYIEKFPGVDGINMHDDWGGQSNTFFSPDTCAEMIVPYMRKVTDHIHSKGLFADLHSCGKIERQVPNMIAAGWDSWSGQPMNDTQMLYEQYGDKIILGVLPNPLSPDATEAEQREAAANFVEKFCNPDKPCFLHRMATITPAFREEAYKLSRIKFSGE